MEIDTNQKKVGGTVDSWCGKCKMMLAHTVEAMVGATPARVHCNTCKSQHAYKAHAPSKTTRVGRPRATGEKRSDMPRARANRYQALLNDKDLSAAKNYSIKEIY